MGAGVFRGTTQGHGSDASDLAVGGSCLAPYSGEVLSASGCRCRLHLLRLEAYF